MAKEGEQRKGQLHKGPVTAPLKSVPGYKPVCSIPAKFETILYTGPREKKGFSAESRRFQEPENDLPGPGSYNSQPLPLDQTRPESIGKKGFGAMVSQTRRFSHRICYTGPGPADYIKHKPAVDGKSFSKAAVTSAFQDKSASSLVPLDRGAPHLGPGTYEGAGITRKGDRVDYTSRPGASSAFKATGGHELILAGNLEAPPPTSYDLGDPWDMTHPLSRGGSRMGTSSFSGNAGRYGGSVGSMAATLDSLLFGAPSAAAAKPETGPGPGAYELQDFASIRAKLSREAHRPSPQFLTPENAAAQRRQSRQVLASTSEKVAHDYLEPTHAPLHSHSPPKGVSAPFRSRSAGHEEVIDQRSYAASANAPGPAYYQPPTVLRKSFHRNNKKNYMTLAF
ncbi:hypothetical protein Agub_g8039 [Astrephomene gubernaculifera]|uniref:Sperm-tail PG-rich repeat-containing protein 2 n=1 Tax=Astrephomene gubernaculifera TaxID=47775 RepID=A0AAD3DTP8_9CHLO|nr:hypothetical protein Agub_g8039 [Astrephomene gubernaculifera]